MDGPEQTDGGRPGRTSWPTGVVVAVLLVLLGTVTGVGLRADPVPASTAARLAAGDGFRGFASFTADGAAAPAMVENARLTGPQTDSSVPQALWDVLDQDPADAGGSAHWWREGVVVTGFSHPAQRYRLRLIGTDGVRLAGQEWAGHGIALSPALLELPSDVRVGEHWTSRGRALADPVEEVLDYTNSSVAGRPDTEADAEAGCLTVRSVTTLTPADTSGSTPSPRSSPGSSRSAGSAPSATAGSVWSEQNLWCPGRGVVASGGDFRGTPFSLGRLAPDPTPDLTRAGLTEARALTGDPSAWTSGPLRLEGGDDTFGNRAGVVDTGARLIARDGTGALHVLNVGERDVNTLTPLTTHQLWAHGWLRPGGSVTALTSVGRLILVATSERRLDCYDYAGRLHWSLELPDLAVTSPVPLVDGRVLVTTVRGDVLAVDLLTGTPGWRQRLSGSIESAPAAGDGVAVVATTDGSLTAFDVDGHQLWQQDAAAVSPTVVVTGDMAVSMVYGQLQARDLRTGSLRWSRAGLGATDGLRVLDDAPAVLNSRGVRSFSPADGSLRWDRPLDGVTDAVSLGRDRVSLLLGTRAVVAIDDKGDETRRWALTAPLGASGRLLPGSGQAWAVGATDQALTGTWIGSRPPGPA